MKDLSRRFKNDFREGKAEGFFGACSCPRPTCCLPEVKGIMCTHNRRATSIAAAQMRTDFCRMASWGEGYRNGSYHWHGCLERPALY